MWEPRRLTTLWAFTACYRDSFTFYPLDRRLGGPQARSGGYGEQKNFALPGIEPGPSTTEIFLKNPCSDKVKANKYILEIYVLIICDVLLS
jgi:hypothetical protein